MKTQSTLTKRVSMCFSLFLLAGLAILQGVAGAAVPAFDTLSSLTDMITAPTDVALDQQGNIYIAETTKNRVRVLDQGGQYTGRTITGIKAPISVAIDAAGRVLVGSADNGSVSVFSPTLRFLSKLGSGDGEFGKPMDIAIDAAGFVYVVDNTNNVINVYNAAGAKTGSIGAPGNGPGQLHHPTSMAIDNNAGEIVVLDHQQILDPTTNRMVDGARIQYFDMNGASLRSYSKYGYNNAGMVMDPVTYQMSTKYDITMGQLTKPNQVAVDSQSRIYVTDARLQKVMVYDNTDNFLAAIDNDASPLRIPMGITASSTNMLYVASLFGGKVEAFGVDNYTALAASPSTVEFSAVENAGAPSSGAATLTNMGNSELNWSASTPDSWISIGNAAGTLAVSGNASLDITVDPAGLAAGTHNGSVAITTDTGATASVSIVMNVAANPLQVTPMALVFKTTDGTSASVKQVVTATNVGTINWDVSADQPWIVLDKTAGSTPSAIKVYADASSLGVGQYDGIITLVQVDNPAVNIPVTLVITQSTPAETPGAIKLGSSTWDKRWSTSQQLTGTSAVDGTDLLGVSGTSKKNAIAVGTDGAILHYNGRNWTAKDSGPTSALNSVWSDSQNSAYAVGANGLVLDYDGTVWTETSSGGSSLQDTWASDTATVTVGEFGVIYETGYDHGVVLRSVWGNADNDVYVVGQEGAIFNFDGSVWNSNTSGTTEWLNGVWASSATDVFAVGENGTIVHFDGTAWSAMASGTTANLNGICGTASDDVYAVGDNSLIFYYDGSAWVAADAGVQANLNDIWCSDRGDIVAVGDDGTAIVGKGRKKSVLPQDEPLMIDITGKAK